MVYDTLTRARPLSPALNRNAVGPSPCRPVSPPVRPSCHSLSSGSPTLPILHEGTKFPSEGPSSVSETKPGGPLYRKRSTDAPITRGLSHRIAPFLASAHSAVDGGSERDTDPCPAPACVAASPSPGRLPRTTTAPHVRYRKRARRRRATTQEAYVHMTSTPKRYRQTEAAINSPKVARRRFMPRLASQTWATGARECTAQSGSRECAVSLRGRAAKTLRSWGRWRAPAGARRYAGVPTESRQDATVVSIRVREEELDSKVVFGLDEVTMPIAGSDRDVPGGRTRTLDICVESY